MILVNAPPLISPDREGKGWELVLYMGDGFDYDFPFRATLDRIVALLGGAEAASLDLPAWQEGEDFIEGGLDFGGATISVYFEYALGYLSLSSPSREALEDAAARILPDVRVS